jgi:hypothetical protein
MGQPGAVMITFMEDENLGFVLQAAERGGMLRVLLGGSVNSRPRLRSGSQA